MTETAVVDVAPWYQSKINWTQMLGMAASLATVFGWTVPADLVPATVGALVGLQSVVTIVLKTWFTKTITASSAASL